MPTDVLDVDRMLQLAAGCAAWTMGMAEEEAAAVLDQVQNELRTDLARRFGDDIANAIADAFTPAVISARRSLEAAGTPGVVN